MSTWTVLSASSRAKQFRWHRLIQSFGLSSNAPRLELSKASRVLEYPLPADNDLKLAIVKGVRRREPSIDFMSSQEAGLDEISDTAVLDRAHAGNRVLVSHDRRTMIGHFRDRLLSGNSSPGLLIVSQGAATGDVVEAIVYVWTLFDPNDLRNQAHYLPSMSRHLFTR